MNIYIASSWKNHHAVEMLTALLRGQGHTVISWVENNYGEKHAPDETNSCEWILSPSADRAFHFDTHGAMNADLVVYLAPSGSDAWAEVGAAYGNGVPIIGLWSKGEQSGLMRKMMFTWVTRYTDLLKIVRNFSSSEFVDSRLKVCTEKQETAPVTS